MWAEKPEKKPEKPETAEKDGTVRHKSEVVGARGGFIYEPDEGENGQAADTALPRSQRKKRKGDAAAPCPLLDNFCYQNVFAPTGEELGHRKLGRYFSARV